MITATDGHAVALRLAARAVAALDLYEANRPVSDFYAAALNEAADSGNHAAATDLFVDLGVIADRAHDDGDLATADRLETINRRLYRLLNGAA